MDNEYDFEVLSTKRFEEDIGEKHIECQYCCGIAKLVDSSVIYGKSYGNIYLCKPCKAYVGVHKATDKPLGTLANAETREARKAAHAAFDPLWKDGLLKRKAAYKWLAEMLNVDEIHIGQSNIDMCNRIVEIVKGNK